MSTIKHFIIHFCYSEKLLQTDFYKYKQMFITNRFLYNFNQTFIEMGPWSMTNTSTNPKPNPNPILFEISLRRANRGENITSCRRL